MKKTIRDYNLYDKKVIIRCDFNVPIANNVILDDNRIVASLDTIEYAINNGAKVILLSHLGRIKEASDLANNSLDLVAKRLEELLKRKVIFVDVTRGKKLEKAIKKMRVGSVVLIQNTRYEDLDGKKESSNDLELASYWASLGDIYINDAFGTSHRAHASNVGLASILPNGIGFLIEKEVNILERSVNNPKRPFTVILGGAKVNDKIGVIENLVKIADYILIGGGMAYTFLASKGLNVGKSLVDKENIDFCKKILDNYSSKIILPVDNLVANEINNSSMVRVAPSDNIQDMDIALDIGPKTVTLFNEYLMKSKTIIWNGPVGFSEIKNFSKGTKALCETLSKLDAITIIGGGDTASSVINLGYKDKFTHISTGGGATLELLEGKDLPGISIISNL
ncbi:MAG: phosphoglycerate kinase [Bacilli bacterium]|nr:phosphoglycerate kinase [Bacilli bacterium]